MTDEYRLFIRDNAITTEQALFNLRNALRGTSIDELESKSYHVEEMRGVVSRLVSKLERMGRNNEEQE